MKTKIEKALLKEVLQTSNAVIENIELRHHQNCNNVMLNAFRGRIIIDKKIITYVIDTYGINREFRQVCYSIN
jgi:hypothetical protein